MASGLQIRRVVYWVEIFRDRTRHRKETIVKSKHRVLTGLAIALVGLLGCLPVPIGDPEKSRIDPELNGMWLMDGGDSDPAVTLFEPYDKRTWLISQFPIAENVESCDWDDDVVVEGEDEEEKNYDYMIRYFEAHGADCFGGERVAHYKAWRTKLGGRWFMTWEPKGLYEEEFGFANQIWLAWRIDKAGSDRFSLKMIDADYDGFEDLEDYQEIAELDPPFNHRKLKSARREVERVIRKNTDDDDLYDGGSVFFRVQPEYFALFENTITSVIYDMFEK